MASGDKEGFPLAGVIQPSRIVISQQSPSPSPGGAKPQSYKVFVLPPSQLNNLGLVAKHENGRVILTQRPGESPDSNNATPNSNAAMSLSFIKSPGGIQIQSGQSSSSVKTSRKGYVTSAEGMKGGVREFQMHRQLTKITTPGTSPLGNTASSTSRPTFARRSSSRRLLPQFTNYWKKSLEEVGYIRCPLRGCNYICMNFGEMTIHYYQCKGEPFATKFVCTPCNGRLKSEEDLKSHLIQTHSREGRIAKRQLPKKVVEIPKQEEKKVWIRKRAYSKVHKISWNIALGNKGYVNCFFKNCSFMALDLNQMIQHYGICNGTTSATSVECPYCDACAECLEKLEAHVEKNHAGNPSVLQAVKSEVNIPVSGSLPVPDPLQETDIASAVTSDVGIGSLCVHQKKETVVQSQKQKQKRLASVKTSASMHKSAPTVLSMKDKLPKRLEQSHSRLYSSDTISKTTTGSLSSSADTEVHCLFSMYEDFDEQRGLESDLSLDSQLSNVGLSVKRERENASTVLCKTYSKDNQRLVKDDSYNERISSPLSALPCSFSDNISLCTEISDLQIMRSSMSEGENIMLVETKPEACVVEKLHEYMSRCDMNNIFSEENVSTCRTFFDPKGQKDFIKSSVSHSKDRVSQENSSPQYEIFHDTEPEYPQEYSINTSVDKTVNSDDINLSQNNADDLEDEQITVEDCMVSEPCSSSSLVSYTEDVEEYIIPEIIEMTQYVVESPVEICSKAINKRIQKPKEKRIITSSQVPTNVIGNLVPGIATITNGYKKKEKTNNNVAKVHIERPKNINPHETVKSSEPRACDGLPKKVQNTLQISHDSSSRTVGTSLTDIQSAHPLFADTEDLQNLDVPVLALVDDQKDNLLNSFPNTQLINVQDAESRLSEQNKELIRKKRVRSDLVISDVDKITYSVERENSTKAIRKPSRALAETSNKICEHLVPEDTCNTRLTSEVNVKCEDDVQLDITLNDNVTKCSLKTQENDSGNQTKVISTSGSSGESMSGLADQHNRKHKTNVTQIAINMPCVSETCKQKLRNIKKKQNDLGLGHSAAKSFPQVDSVLKRDCDVQHDNKLKTSEVLSDDLQDNSLDTFHQIESPVNSSNIPPSPQAHSVPKKKNDKLPVKVDRGIAESQNESNQTMTFNRTTRSHSVKFASQVGFENSTTDKFVSDRILEQTIIPLDQTTKEEFCNVANASLKETSSRIEDQTLKLVNSEAADEFSHFHEMKNSVCDSIPSSVGSLKDIQIAMAEEVNSREGTMEKNTSNFEGSSHENELKSLKPCIDSNFTSIPVLQGIESKIAGNKSSEGSLLSEPLVITVEELESTNLKRSDNQISALLTNIEDESKTDSLLGNNKLSETFGSEDGPECSLRITGFMSSVSESRAVITEKSSIEMADKTLQEDEGCDTVDNLSKVISNTCIVTTSAIDNQLNSSSNAVNDFTSSSCNEQKHDNINETFLECENMSFKTENNDVCIKNSSRARDLLPDSQTLMPEDNSIIVSESAKEKNVEEMVNFQNDEKKAMISLISEMPICSVTLQEKNQDVDSSSMKVLEDDLISTTSNDVQGGDQLCSNYKLADSINKMEVYPTPLQLVSESLQSNAQIASIECTSLESDVAKATGKTYSQSETVSEKGLHFSQMSDSKKEIENKAQVVCEVSTGTQNAVNESKCTSPLVEDLGALPNKEISDCSVQMVVEMVRKNSQDEKISVGGSDASLINHGHENVKFSENQLSSTIEMAVEGNALVQTNADTCSEIKIKENFEGFQDNIQSAFKEDNFKSIFIESLGLECHKKTIDKKSLDDKEFSSEITNKEVSSEGIQSCDTEGELIEENLKISDSKVQLISQNNVETDENIKERSVVGSEVNKALNKQMEFVGEIAKKRVSSESIQPCVSEEYLIKDNVKTPISQVQLIPQNNVESDEDVKEERWVVGSKDKKTRDEKMELVSETAMKKDISEITKPFTTEGDLKFPATQVVSIPQYVETDDVSKEEKSDVGNEDRKLQDEQMELISDTTKKGVVLESIEPFATEGDLIEEDMKIPATLMEPVLQYVERDDVSKEENSVVGSEDNKLLDKNMEFVGETTKKGDISESIGLFATEGDIIEEDLKIPATQVESIPQYVETDDVSIEEKSVGSEDKNLLDEKMEFVSETTKKGSENIEPFATEEDLIEEDLKSPASQMDPVERDDISKEDKSVVGSEDTKLLDETMAFDSEISKKRVISDRIETFATERDLKDPALQVQPTPQYVECDEDSKNERLTFGSEDQSLDEKTEFVSEISKKGAISESIRPIATERDLIQEDMKLSAPQVQHTTQNNVENDKNIKEENPIIGSEDKKSLDEKMELVSEISKKEVIAKSIKPIASGDLIQEALEITAPLVQPISQYNVEIDENIKEEKSVIGREDKKTVDEKMEFVSETAKKDVSSESIQPCATGDDLKIPVPQVLPISQYNVEGNEDLKENMSGIGSEDKLLLDEKIEFVSETAKERVASESALEGDLKIPAPQMQPISQYVEGNEDLKEEMSGIGNEDKTLLDEKMDFVSETAKKRVSSESVLEGDLKISAPQVQPISQYNVESNEDFKEERSGIGSEDKKLLGEKMEIVNEETKKGDILECIEPSAIEGDLIEEDLKIPATQVEPIPQYVEKDISTEEKSVVDSENKKVEFVSEISKKEVISEIVKPFAAGDLLQEDLKIAVSQIQPISQHNVESNEDIKEERPVIGSGDEKSLDEKVEFISEAAKKEDISDSINPFAAEDDLKIPAPQVPPTSQYNVESDNHSKEEMSAFGSEDKSLDEKMDFVSGTGKKGVSSKSIKHCTTEVDLIEEDLIIPCPQVHPISQYDVESDEDINEEGSIVSSKDKKLLDEKMEFVSEKSEEDIRLVSESIKPCTIEGDFVEDDLKIPGIQAQPICQYNVKSDEDVKEETLIVGREDSKSLDEKMEYANEIPKKGDTSERIQYFATGDLIEEDLKIPASQVLPISQCNLERDEVVEENGSSLESGNVPVMAKVGAGNSLSSEDIVLLESENSNTCVSLDTKSLVQEDKNATDKLNNEDQMNNITSEQKTSKDSKCVTVSSFENLEIVGSELILPNLSSADKTLEVHMEVDEVSFVTDRPADNVEQSIDVNLTQRNQHMSIVKIEENIVFEDRKQSAKDSNLTTCEVAENLKTSLDLEREVNIDLLSSTGKETTALNKTKEETYDNADIQSDIKSNQPESSECSEFQSDSVLVCSDNDSKRKALSLLNNPDSHECATVQIPECFQKSELFLEDSKAENETVSHKLQSGILMRTNNQEENIINHEVCLDTSNKINLNDPQTLSEVAVALKLVNSSALSDVQCVSETKTSETLADELQNTFVDTACKITPPINFQDLSPSLTQDRSDSSEKALSEPTSAVEQESEQVLNDKLTSENSVLENVVVIEKRSDDLIGEDTKIVRNESMNLKHEEKIEFNCDVVQETVETANDTQQNKNSGSQNILVTEKQADSICEINKNVNMECDDVELESESRESKSNIDVLLDPEQDSRNDLASKNSEPGNDHENQQLDDMKGETPDCNVKEISDSEKALTGERENIHNTQDAKNILMSCQKQDTDNPAIPFSLPFEKTDNLSSVDRELTFSENPPQSGVSESSLTVSPKISKQTSESSTDNEKALKSTAEILQSTSEKTANSVHEVQEFINEEPILSCNINIVADTENITDLKFSAKSNILEFTGQKEMHKAKEEISNEMVESNNENKQSASAVQLLVRNESKNETVSTIESAEISHEESSTLTVIENKSVGVCEQSTHSPASNKISCSETATDLSENVKPLSLENLSIALAGEMEDSIEQVSPHEMMNVDSYGSKAYSDDGKPLITQEAFAKTFENFTSDSPRGTSGTDKKIYSTLDLQQILEGSDDSKPKLEDEETSISMIARTSVLGCNESKDMLQNSEESDPSQSHDEKEIATDSNSSNETQKNFEKSNSSYIKQMEKLDENMICSFDSEVKLQSFDMLEVKQEKTEIYRPQILNEDIDETESELLCPKMCDSHEEMDVDTNANVPHLGNEKRKSVAKSKENALLPEDSTTEFNKISSCHDKTAPRKKRSHSVDFLLKAEIHEKNVNDSPPVKRRRRSSSFCSDTNKKIGKSHLLKTTLIKETVKLNELKNLETNANSEESRAEIHECSSSTEKQISCELGQEKVSDDDVAFTEETSVIGKKIRTKNPKSTCGSNVAEGSSVSNTSVRQQKRELDDAEYLSVETNDNKVNAELETVACSKTKVTDLISENTTEQVRAEPLRKRRKRSIETNMEAAAESSSRRQSLRNKTNVLSEDSNSSNSSVSSACDNVESRKTRRGRKSKTLPRNVNVDENSILSTPSQENSENTTLNHMKNENQDEKETQQKILPFDLEQSIMSEDSVFSKTDSQSELDTRSNNSLEIDDSASSIVSDTTDCADDSQIGIDQDSDLSEIGTSGRGRGRSRGRGRRRSRGRGGRGRRGRGRGRDSQNFPREEQEKDNDVQEESTEVTQNEQPRPDCSGEVRCGKCGDKMLKKSYDRHNIFTHNGLGWLEGEPPFDMTDEKRILSILWKVVKNHRKQLTCENCGESKKSAVGFCSHIGFCMRSAEEREKLKVKCDICGRLMIPASLKVHQQIHRNDNKKPEPVIIETTTRIKRAAAAKATSLMQEVIKEESQLEERRGKEGSEEAVDFCKRVGPAKAPNPILAKWRRLIAAEGEAACHFPGCTFKSTQVAVLAKHFGTCEKSPRRAYRCELCTYQSKDVKDMKHHLEVEHMGTHEDSDPEEDAEAMKKIPTKTYCWKMYNKLLFLGREMSGPIQGDKPYIPAVKWTLKFMKENYAKDDLFPEQHTSSRDWIPVPESEYNEYLPQTKESISFSTLAMRGEVVSTDSVTYNWRKMKIFESDIIDGVPTIFTGGPIWALAWTTNPLAEMESETREQFLAISCHRQMSDTYKSNERYVGKGLIQLWNFGPLDNLQKPSRNPKFVLGIAHEHGTVWDLEWCPSGCYETSSTNEHLQRLGLLAAACSDGCVHIFSVCFPSFLDNGARYPIFRCKPVMTLIASENLSCELGGLPWSCLRLSWYKGKNHSVMAGGFNNGMVSLWNIKTESLLLRKQEENTSVLLPYKSFQAHLSCVTALSLAPQDEGRYLMTGSIDTTIKIWDMEETSGPIPPVVRKGMVTDGIWLTHWLSSITSYDDVYSMGHCNTTLNPPRGYGFKIFPLLPQNSVAWSLSTTDWVNGVAQGSHAGELTAIFPHQLVLNVDTEKGMKDKRMMLSYVELKDILNKTDEHKCNALCSVPCQKQQLGDIQKEVESNKSNNLSENEKIVFQTEEKDENQKSGLSFIIERNPRKGKKCVITPVSEETHDSTSVSDLSSTNDSVDEKSNSPDNIECISMLNQHERRLLLTFKKDLERLNVTSRLKVTFPYYNNEKKRSNSNDTVKEYLMIVGSMKDVETQSIVQEKGGPSKATKGSSSLFTIPSDDYEAVESKFGLIFCDFPAEDMSTIPACSRLWMRRSETMKTAPVEIYPVTSLNKVKWNPNWHSFLCLAAGYQCGLLRVPCISGMHSKEVELVLRNTPATGRNGKSFNRTSRRT